jgi:hypothetical protein
MFDNINQLLHKHNLTLIRSMFIFVLTVGCLTCLFWMLSTFYALIIAAKGRMAMQNGFGQRQHEYIVAFPTCVDQ